MRKSYLKARKYLRKVYGKRYQAFPIDELEMVDYFYWINDKCGVRIH